MLLLFWKDRGPSNSNSNSAGLGVTYCHQMIETDDNLYQTHPVSNPASYAVPSGRSGVEYRQQSPTRGVS